MNAPGWYTWWPNSKKEISWRCLPNWSLEKVKSRTFLSLNHKDVDRDLLEKLQSTVWGCMCMLGEIGEWKRNHRIKEKRKRESLGIKSEELAWGKIGGNWKEKWLYTKVSCLSQLQRKDPWFLTARAKSWMNGGFGALEKRKTDLPKTGQEQNMCYRKRLASERWKKVLSTHGTVTPCEPNQPSPWPGWLLRNTPWLIAPGPTADWLGLLSSQGSSLHGLTIHYSPWHVFVLLSSSITCDSSSSCEIMSGLENWYPVEEGESWHGVYAAPTATHSFASKDSETIRKMQIHTEEKWSLFLTSLFSGDLWQCLETFL